MLKNRLPVSSVIAWLFAAGLSCALASSPASAATKWALLVGIDQYQRHTISTLNDSIADVKSVAQDLQRYEGFPADHVFTMTSDITDVEDPDCPTNNNVFDRLSTLSQHIQPGDTFLFYFSGHGFQRGENGEFLGTVNADPLSVSSLKLTTIPLGYLQDEMQQIQARQVIFILDACRNDPEKSEGDAPNRETASLKKDLQQVVDSAAGGHAARAILFACSEGQHAYEWERQGHGVFTYYLLQGLEGKAVEPGTSEITIHALQGYLQTQVADWCLDHNKAGEEEQTPDIELKGAADIILGQLNQPLWPPRMPQVQPGIIPATPITAINPKDGAEMIFIPAGEFTMGDNDLNTSRKDCPEHRASLDSYWIYKNDVTVAQYQKFCNETGRQMPPEPSAGIFSWHWADHQNDPIVNVTWDDASAYCQWAGASLPTEAEWEKAARGTDGRVYPWGNQLDPGKVWSSLDGIKQSTSAVGSFPAGASPYGVMDMAGNVWNWCADWYDTNYYANSPQRNPQGPATPGQCRVRRGGSWNNYNPSNFRSTYRDSPLPPSLHYISNGFRAVLRAGSGAGQ